jgi:hypothetical protein
MYRSAPLCTFQFAVDFLVLDEGGKRGVKSEGENKMGGGVEEWEVGWMGGGLGGGQSRVIMLLYAPEQFKLDD